MTSGIWKGGVDSVSPLTALTHYGTGRRKTAVARVWLVEGNGRITVNGKDISEYFSRPLLETQVRAPLKAVNAESRYDVKVNVHGGGISAQAGAIRHGIARALVSIDEEMRPVLKKAGFLTRDPRMKERRKYGLKKARKAPQFSKR